MFCDQCGKELQENEVCTCQEQANEVKQTPFQKESSVSRTMIVNYLTAIIYPLLFVILAVLLYSWNETSLLGLIVAICFDIAAAVVILLGGFYFLIIPLPYIFVYRGGCLKPYLPTWQKVLYGILSFVLLFGSIGILFLFSLI